jgi:mycothiol synthase
VNLRAPRADETAQIAELLTAAAEESGLGAVEPEEVAQWLSSPTFDVQQNFRVVEGDGTLLAYCDLTTAFDEGTHVSMDVRSRPGAEEAAAAVLDWARVRAEELASGRTGLRTGVSDRDTAKRRLLEERGFAAVRHSFQMLVDFDGEPEPPRWAEGINIVQLHPKRNDRAAFDAFQEAFRDAWGFVPMPFEEWRHMRLAAHDFSIRRCTFSRATRTRSQASRSASPTARGTPATAGSTRLASAGRGGGVASARRSCGILLASCEAVAVAAPAWTSTPTT